MFNILKYVDIILSDNLHYYFIQIVLLDNRQRSAHYNFRIDLICDLAVLVQIIAYSIGF
jgi:hypothetical protein